MSHVGMKTAFGSNCIPSFHKLISEPVSPAGQFPAGLPLPHHPWNSRALAQTSARSQGTLAARAGRGAAGCGFLAVNVHETPREGCLGLCEVSPETPFFLPVLGKLSPLNRPAGLPRIVGCVLLVSGHSGAPGAGLFARARLQGAAGCRPSCQGLCCHRGRCRRAAVNHSVGAAHNGLLCFQFSDLKPLTAGNRC